MATPEQWAELRARVEALEAQVSGLQSCHNTTADHLLDIMAMVRGTSSAEAQPAPAGSLVERVADALCRAQLDSPSWEPEARAAIREVAAWFRRGDAGAGSAWTVAADVLDAVLREEADRSTSQED
jgi:hypothetical protein